MTETKDMKFPGSYSIKKAVLTPLGGGRSFDIGGMVPTMQIDESMQNDCIRGSLTVFDFVGLIDKMPLRAEERLDLTIIDPMDAEHTYDLFVYKVDNVETTSENHGVTYTLHFVSYQRWIASRRKIVRGFKFLTVSQIAATVFEDYYRVTRAARPSDAGGMPGQTVTDPLSKDMLVADTEGVFECTIPNMTPMQTLEFLTRRAYSEKYPSCSYRFFENTRGYFFAPDELLYETAVKQRNVFKMTSLANTTKTNETFEFQMANLDNVRFARRSNTMEDLHGGAYVSKIFVIDILKGTADVRPLVYKFLENRDKYFLGRESQNDTTDRHTEKFINENFTEENAKTFLFVKDYADESGGQMAADKHIPEIAQHRLAYRQHLTSTMITASGPGRMDVTCGDVVEFENIRNHQETVTTDPQLSGHYLVMSVQRVFERDAFTNHYVMVKCAWEKE